MKAVISLMLLVVFGLSLSSDIFVPHFDNAALESFFDKSNETLNQVHEAQCADVKAHDFCTLGFCHWGHCSFVVRLENLNIKDRTFASVFSLSQNMFYSSPSLDGLRRPPRIG